MVVQWYNTMLWRLAYVGRLQVQVQGIVQVLTIPGMHKPMVKLADAGGTS